MKFTILSHFKMLYMKIRACITVSNVFIQGKKLRKFGVFFSDWRAEPDKTNMFQRKFSPSILPEKKSKRLYFL
jgi:hypothetical protein